MVTHWAFAQLAGLWPLVWHFGLGGAVILACVAVYALQPAFLTKLFPNIQKILIWVATTTVVIMVSTAIGVRLGENRIQAQWDVAKANTLQEVKAARAGAVRDVARKPSRWVRSRRRDPNQRD